MPNFLAETACPRERGILFLDELGEFDSRTIDAMRQPVEDGYVRINRNLEEITFPSKTMIVAAANPCKCGNLWDETRICTCTQRQLDSHRRKLSGPFSDRIDMHIKISAVPREKLLGDRQAIAKTSSAEMRMQVKAAVQLQQQRYAGTPYDSNGGLDEKGIEIYCVLGKEERNMINAAYEKYSLSMRAYGKVLKLSRTIADLDNSKDIGCEHIAEALMYRISEWDGK